MKLIIGLVAVSLMSGCASMHHSTATTHTSTRTIDGSMGFHVRATYGGWPESDGPAKERAEATLDHYSNGICKNGYTKLGEQESILVNQFGYGSGHAKNLYWEIKCKDAAQSVS